MAAHEMTITMTFIEVPFLFFLVAAVAAFYICPVKHRWKVLLAASIAFYAAAGLKFLPFIFVTSFSVFLAGRRMGAVYGQMALAAEGKDRKGKKALKEAAKARCRKLLICLLILNIGILAVVKFTKFAVGPINGLLTALGREGTFDASFIIVPLGISYYTFSCLSYLLDVYWRRVDFEPDYARFLLYAIYFPHILQGPIERYGNLGQRLKAELRFDYARVCKGVQLMLWGFFKKLVIADRINLFTDAVYAADSEAAGAVYLVAFFLDIVFIYADFSGYMDIARGVSQIFGVELDLNFNHPFASKSITEFWRRWHMSLGSWFRDYVYYPVSTSKLLKSITKACRKRFPDAVTKCIITAIPVTVTWVLTGLWHGTGKNYVAWGIYYAIMIFISSTFGDWLHGLAVKMHINTETWSWRLFQMVRTTCIFGGGRFLTRPGSLHASWYAFRSILTTYNPEIFFNKTLYQFGLDKDNIFLLAAAILVFGLVGILQERGVKIRDTLEKQNLAFRWLIYLAAVFSILVFGVYGPGYDAADFVYMAY